MRAHVGGVGKTNKQQNVYGKPNVGGIGGRATFEKSARSPLLGVDGFEFGALSLEAVDEKSRRCRPFWTMPSSVLQAADGRVRRRRRTAAPLGTAAADTTTLDAD